MDIRTLLEKKEKDILSPLAAKSFESRGRLRFEEPCQVRTAFQHDRDRILHSKAFRRLKHKTQVFLAPEGDHYRTRLTHTLEVSQIARTVSRALGLNEDLTEAIALGHDLGHTPFGHAGERVLNKLVPGGFRHVSQSLRVVSVLEKDGKGLNLTEEVRDGILKHSKGQGDLFERDEKSKSLTLEGAVVRLADVVAYVNHDLDDALRAGLVTPEEIPNAVTNVVGTSRTKRIDTMVKDMIDASDLSGGGRIALSPPVQMAIESLRDWLFDHVYQADPVKVDFRKASRILEELFVYFTENPDELVSNGGLRLPGDKLERSIADFIAGMTDRYAINLYHRLFLPQPWKV